ncbi:hypothetical protein HLRTI_000527 [Halorhabdus tiamatea SARL4B]|uniref:Uncharacterized protein n=1 Tax=Halorhabdus tiamatea SARL4B TaxID=1033806 RepID=F7PLX1_9EURY|nr:hypothetical protein [Halorhabdus tiamatea]ERJ07484.1 hypothetical protein HLRTI_000527 [Halorhabdus tiamatea SARL4B]
MGEDFRLLSHGPADETDLLEDLSAPYREFIHIHDPWDRAFVIWWDQMPARIVAEYRDMFVVTPSPEKPPGERPSIYAKKAGGKRGLVPRCQYERADDSEASVDLRPHPVEGQEHMFRLVSKNSEPVPNLAIQTWDFGVEQPAIDAERHFTRGDQVRIADAEEVGTVESVIGRTAAVNLDRIEGYELEQYRPSDLELVDQRDRSLAAFDGEQDAE